MRQALRSPHQLTAVRVSKKRNLVMSSPEELFATSGVTDEEFLDDLKEVAVLMVGKRSQDAGFPLSYFELFVHGLTNIARSLYFGTDLAIELAEENLRINNSECGMGIGDEEDQFLFDYVKFLVSQDLAMIDCGDCLIDWEDRRIQPHFVAATDIARPKIGADGWFGRGPIEKCWPADLTGSIEGCTGTLFPNGLHGYRYQACSARKRFRGTHQSRGGRYR